MEGLLFASSSFSPRRGILQGFNVDDEAWLIVGGDPKKGANVHKVVVTDIAGAEVVDPNAPGTKVPGITVKREGHEDRENLDGYEPNKTYGSCDHRAREYPPMTFQGLVEDAEVHAPLTPTLLRCSPLSAHC